MPTYYLYREKDKHTVPVGETSFNSFYCSHGWAMLNILVDNNDPMINEYVIRRDDKKEELSIEEFLDEIEKYKLRLDNL